MTISLLTAKAFLAPAAGVVVVGAGVGGTYYVYTNRPTTNTTTGSDVSIKTFLARIKETGTGTITGNKPLKCLIEAGKEVTCKVLKFTTAQTNNAITKFEKTTLQAIATPSTDLVQHNYVVVELKDTKVTFNDLKNKSIELKSETTKITTLEFDQVLIESKQTQPNKPTYEPIPAVTDTYIVSTTASPTSGNADSTISGFRCKYTSPGESTKLVNVDDSCKLIAIKTPDTGKNITSFTELQSSATNATDLAVSTFYKLTINRNLFYNLDFENALGTLKVEVAISSATKSDNLTIHQKLSSDGYMGKTNLVLGKVTTTKAEVNGTATGNKCNFNKETPETGNFECGIHAAAESGATNPTDLHKLTITTSATTSDAFEAGKYFVIKLTAPQDISILTKGKKIYYQMAKSGSSDSKHDSVELEIAELLSGDFTDSKKPLYITNYSSAASAP